MSYLNTVTVFDEEYIIQTMGATQQWEVFNIFSKYGLEDALYHMSVGQTELVSATLFGKFANSAPDNVKAKVTEMLLGNCLKVVKDGENKVINIDMFHNRILAFIMLHIEALKVNYADFFEYLQSPAQVEAETQTEAGEMSQI